MWRWIRHLVMDDGQVFYKELLYKLTNRHSLPPTHTHTHIGA